jgi:hypothetical protein
VRVLNEPAIRARFAQLQLDIASAEQRAEGLAALHKAEIEKWCRSSSQPTSKCSKTYRGAPISGPVKFVMALLRRLADYPFRAPGLPWYFRRAARHAREEGLMSSR